MVSHTLDVERYCNHELLTPMEAIGFEFDFELQGFRFHHGYERM